MSFMEPQVEFGTWIVVDGNNGVDVIPSDLVSVADVVHLRHMLEVSDTIELADTVLADYVESRFAYSIEIKEAWGARLSAPGYMDCTPWCVLDSEKEAYAYLEDMYDDDDDDDDESSEDGFDKVEGS